MNNYGRRRGTATGSMLYRMLILYLFISVCEASPVNTKSDDVGRVDMMSPHNVADLHKRVLWIVFQPANAAVAAASIAFFGVIVNAICGKADIAGCVGTAIAGTLTAAGTVWALSGREVEEADEDKYIQYVEGAKQLKELADGSDLSGMMNKLYRGDWEELYGHMNHTKLSADIFIGSKDGLSYVEMREKQSDKRQVGVGGIRYTWWDKNLTRQYYAKRSFSDYYPAGMDMSYGYVKNQGISTNGGYMCVAPLDSQGNAINNGVLWLNVKPNQPGWGDSIIGSCRSTIPYNLQPGN